MENKLDCSTLSRVRERCISKWIQTRTRFKCDRF